MRRIASGGLKEFIEILVRAIKVGHIQNLFPLHHVADTLVALFAGSIIIQEAVGFVVGGDVATGFFQVVHGIQDHNIAGGRLA